jgi:aspartyl-tRNA synthetase
MLVSEEQQDILSNELKWRSFSCTVEQRSDSTQAANGNSSSHKRRGFGVKEIRPDDDLVKLCDERIDDWKRARDGKGKQVHLTEITPWRDTEHRRYFIAESASSDTDSKNDSQSTIHTLVVLARLAPVHGYQVKWALDFPNSPNGAIEATVQEALRAIPDSPVTFGAGVSEDFVPKANMGNVRSRMMARVYRGVVKSFGLDKKAAFREKFGVWGEQVYICFPKGGLKANEWGEVVKFFQD